MQHKQTEFPRILQWAFQRPTFFNKALSKVFVSLLFSPSLFASKTSTPSCLSFPLHIFSSFIFVTVRAYTELHKFRNI